MDRILDEETAKLCLYCGCWCPGFLDHKVIHMTGHSCFSCGWISTLCDVSISCNVVKCRCIFIHSSSLDTVIIRKLAFQAMQHNAGTEITESISWLLIPKLLVAPGHQQPWYWLCRIIKYYSSTRKDFNYLHHLKCVEIIWNASIYIFCWNEFST